MSPASIPMPGLASRPIARSYPPLPIPVHRRGLIRALHLCAVFSIAANAAQTAQQAVLDINVPSVQISATIERVEGMDAATFHIRDRDGVQQVGAGDLSGPWPDAVSLARLQQAIIWRDPYLIVERRCTGNSWTCGGIAVFRVSDGKARRLGDLGGGEADLRETPAGVSARFRESYARFEGGIPGATHLSHASAPGLNVHLVDSEQGLVVDRQTTCSAGANPLPVLGPPPASDVLHAQAEVEIYFSGIARTALIQRYCDRGADLERTLEVAQRTLSGQNYRALQMAMEQVEPFAAPYASRQPF